MDFGELPPGGSKDSVVVVTNPLDHPVLVKAGTLRFGTQAFSIVGTEPALPVTLAPGEKIRVTLRASPAVDKSLYRDTLRVQLTCAEVRVPLQIGPVPACIVVGDLDFGIVELNQPKTLALSICNDGHGTVSFTSPIAGPLITWEGSAFRIETKTLDSLKTAQLGANECISVPVIFRGTKEESFEVVARIWANTRQCRDTSIWRGTAKKGVSEAPGDRRSGDGGEAIVAIIQPNPTNGITSIAFTLGAPASVKLTLFDASGKELATLVDRHLEAGTHSAVWDASGMPSGSYFCRIAVDGAVRTLPVIIRK
jgi:hypothetical protein